MAHAEQMLFIHNLKDTMPDRFTKSKVLEIGSLNINGSIRPFFKDCLYMGVDVGPGPGVDFVAIGHEITFAYGQWDVVCSTEALEHDRFWLYTWRNMIALCRRGGLVFFTCATEGRAEHGTARTTPADSPLTVRLGWDYYKNLTPADFADECNLDNVFSDYEFIINDAHHDLYFWGIIK